nr:MAG TPA: RNA polymerase subunit [Caudoviricetes sp.]
MSQTTNSIDYCNFCGEPVFTAVHCPWKRGTVHMAHCPECQYFEPIFWQCLYNYKEVKSYEHQYEH